MKKRWLWTAVLLLLLGATLATGLLLEGGDRPPENGDETLTQDADPDAADAPELEGRRKDAPTDPAAGRPQEPAGPRITGLVVDTAGAGIAGARVYGMPASQGEPLDAAAADASDSVAATTSGADGAFHLSTAEAGDAYTVVARTHTGQAAARHGIRAGNDVRLVVAEPARLTGRVLDATGGPVAGAKLALLVTLDALTFRIDAQSDESGRYALDGITVVPADAEARAVWHAALTVEHAGFARLYLDTSDPEDRRGLPPLRPGTGVLFLERAAQHVWI